MRKRLLCGVLGLLLFVLLGCQGETVVPDGGEERPRAETRPRDETPVAAEVSASSADNMPANATTAESLTANTPTHEPGYWLRLGDANGSLVQEMPINDWQIHAGSLTSWTASQGNLPQRWVALARKVGPAYDVVPFRYELDDVTAPEWILVAADPALAQAALWQEEDVQADGSVISYDGVPINEVILVDEDAGLPALESLFQEWFDDVTESVLWIDSILVDDGNGDWTIHAMRKPMFTMVDNAPYTFGCVYPEEEESSDETPVFVIQEISVIITSTLSLPRIDLDQLRPLMPSQPVTTLERSSAIGLSGVELSSIERSAPESSLIAPNTRVVQPVVTPAFTGLEVVTYTLIAAPVLELATAPELVVVEPEPATVPTCTYNQRFSGATQQFQVMTEQPDPDLTLTSYYVTEADGSSKTRALCSAERGECYSFFIISPLLGDIQRYLCLNKFACDENPDQFICSVLDCESVIEGLGPEGWGFGGRGKTSPYPCAPCNSPKNVSTRATTSSGDKALVSR